jgi:hypothetical protein
MQAIVYTEYGSPDVLYGAFAKYVAAPEHAVALKPARMTFEEAAAAPSAALTALQGLRGEARIQPGQKVLISRRSAPVGRAARSGEGHRGGVAGGDAAGHSCGYHDRVHRHVEVYSGDRAVVQCQYLT